MGFIDSCDLCKSSNVLNVGATSICGSDLVFLTREWSGFFQKFNSLNAGARKIYVLSGLLNLWEWFWCFQPRWPHY